MLTTLAYVNDIVKGRDTSWLNPTLEDRFEKLLGAIYISLSRNEPLDHTFNQLNNGSSKFKQLKLRTGRVQVL